MKHLFFTFHIFASHFPAPGIRNRETTVFRHRGISGGRVHRTVTMLCCMMLLFLSGALLGAETHARKVVRVPVFAYERLMVLDEDMNPISGYAYEYIQTIGTYAGWNIEYIPCDGFSDSMDKLYAGEVDLFFDVSHSEERTNKILFSDEPMGHEYYYLYATEENRSITPDDYESMKGKTVGVTSGTIMVDLLKQWCWKKNVDLKIVEYKIDSEKESDLYAGKIDLDLEVNLRAKHDFSAVARIGSSAFYLAAARDRSRNGKNTEQRPLLFHPASGAVLSRHGFRAQSDNR